MSLPKFTSYGCYPLVYRGERSTLLCADCALKEGLTEDSGYIHWEGPARECDECGEEIESAYGDPEEESRDTNNLEAPNE